MTVQSLEEIPLETTVAHVSEIKAIGIGVVDGPQEFEAVSEMPGPHGPESRIRQGNRERARGGE